MSVLDSPQVNQVVFHPRGEDFGYAPAGISTNTGSGNVMISGYLHLNDACDTLILFFHGNGEIAADYDQLAPIYLHCGASFWVVDYRGYGSSTGMPAYSHMFEDADALVDDIPRLEKHSGKTFKHVLVMGRSLGSASAIYLASTRQEQLDGLLLDSPFADGPGLIHRLGGPRLEAGDLAGFEDNVERMSRCALPTLIIHGAEDFIIPFSDALALFNACPNADKRLIQVDGAGHNDLLLRGFDTYLSELREHVAKVTGSVPGKNE